MACNVSRLFDYAGWEPASVLSRSFRLGPGEAPRPTAARQWSAPTTSRQVAGPQAGPNAGLPCLIEDLIIRGSRQPSTAAGHRRGSVLRDTAHQ